MAKLLRRYESTIYGNYRLAYLSYGTLLGVVLWLSLLVLRAVGSPLLYQPENYVTDALMLLGVFGACYHYRSRLPNHQVMLKELLLLGMGTSLLASVVYGLLVWLTCGLIFPDLVQQFIDYRISTMKTSGADVSATDMALNIKLTEHYTAGDWGFIGAFRTFVMSIIVTFFAAIIFRNEKSPVKAK